MSIMVGVGRGAQAGVLIKNAESLERMEKVDTLVIDKTGTLTEGKPSVVRVVTRGRTGENAPSAIGGQPGAGERASTRRSHRQGAEARALPLLAPQDFASPIGKGVTGVVDGRALVIGNARIMAEAGVSTATLDSDAEDARAEGATAIFVAIDGEAAGLIAIADAVKETTPAAIAACGPTACAS